MKYLFTLILFVFLLASCTKDETVSSSQLKDCNGETAIMLDVDLNQLIMDDTIKRVRVSYLPTPTDGNVLKVSFYTQPWDGETSDTRSHVCVLEQSDTSIPVGSNIVYNMEGQVEGWIRSMPSGYHDVSFSIENFCISSTK